jgi:ribosomal protein L12E/L44/L45/RPP1/RPP2
LESTVNLRQALAQQVVAAFHAGAAAISATELTSVLRGQGMSVDHATVMTLLEALELRNCVQLARSAEEDVVLAIYPAIRQFL